MANINFGILDTQLPGRLAAIPQEAQKQQTANMLQAMQMQGAMRQNEMSQMQLDELKSDRAEMVKLQQELEAKGGSPDLGRLANVLMKSPKHFKLGIELSQKIDAQARFDKLNSGDALPPAPTEAPANMLPGVVSAPAGVNNLPAPPVAPPQAQTTIANLNRQIAANMALGTDQGYKYAEMLQKRVDALSKRYTVGTTLMGAEGNIIGTAPAAPQQPRLPNMATDRLIPDGQGGFKPNQQLIDVETKLRQEGRAPAQPPAPSTQTIADPTDPTKAIVIDTRQYRPGGGINSPGVFGYAPPAKTSENIREEELKTAYNTNRILNSAVQIGKILKKTPSASQPGGLEASATAIFGNAGVANLARSGDRQIVAAAQSDIIDSLLYLATGAAYNKEQLTQQRQSYLPAFTDEPGTVAAKQDALRGLIDGAKVRSGRAWTPKMQSAVDLLTGGAATPAAATAATPVAAAKPYSVATPDGKTHGFDTPAALAAFKKAAGLN